MFIQKINGVMFEVKDHAGDTMHFMYGSLDNAIQDFVSALKVHEGLSYPWDEDKNGN